MRCPLLLAELNAELRRRGATPDDIRDTRIEVLRDDRVGPFLRVHFDMSDGSTFSRDTVECQPLLITAAHNAEIAGGVH